MTIDEYTIAVIKVQALFRGFYARKLLRERLLQTIKNRTVQQRLELQEAEMQVREAAVALREDRVARGEERY